MLIVFDDVVSSLKSFTNPAFVDLFYNRRHLLKEGTISLIVSGQKWTLVPTFIRQSFNMLIVFSVAKGQTDGLLHDVSIDIPKKIFAQLVQSLKTFEFLYFNL